MFNGHDLSGWKVPEGDNGLNGKTVVASAQIPGLPARGRIGLQHHGGKREGKWNSPPSLLQFKNIFIEELDN